MQEERPAPLHLLHHIRAGFVDQPAQMRQYRLRKRRSLRNVGVYLRLAHAGSVKHALRSPSSAPHLKTVKFFPVENLSTHTKQMTSCRQKSADELCSA